MHNYEESEAELKAILEAEKWEKYYEEYEVLWEDEVNYKVQNSKIPKGYYECDIYESEPIDTLEFRDHDRYDIIDYYEILDETENENSETIESMQGDYNLMQYYCKDKSEPWETNLKVYHNSERFVTQKEYEAQLDSYPSEYELEQYENQLDNYRSKDELQREEDDYQANLEADKDLYPWEWYPHIQAELEDPEPWELYPEILEALWKEDYGYDTIDFDIRGSS
ncbi:MAG: hypothetical protein OIN84_16505 [Candidatus Methanoperedens sp.]|nr:hypothetical protein [Candidatus Methanoperedens sp. BLZ2]KAB2941323.1 MAG: hypothetical protein F9K14_18545 [Candidatus Methanoperedens sp.]MBZ0173688.1 hypothetical protein [Candidatus Methanoperedens nitroreducens]MCX9079567.1 hypothetical protein [Candidatus Methanoperedens sp.]